MEAESEKHTSAESLKSADFGLSAFSQALTIGFDGKRAVQNFTGLGNYSRYIIEILAEYFPSNGYRVYSPREPDRQKHGDFGRASTVSFHYPKRKWFKSFWRSYSIIRDLKNDGVQVYHGLSNEIPFGIKSTEIASVVTIHDLIFLRYPQYYPWFDRKMYEFKFTHACRNADKIIAISEQTKRDIIHYFNISEDRIEVIYQNCNRSFREVPAIGELERVRQAYKLPQRYLLNVGTIESRKNLLLIVQALKKIDADTHLVVIGRKTAYTEKVNRYILENGLADRVHFLSNVSQGDLPNIYRQAEIFVFPSEFEGFGIPVIEALHCRIPVIAAKGSSLEEAGGPESMYVSPFDSTELAEAIESVLNNPVKRSRMIEAGAEHLKRFDDQKIAQKLINLYQTLIAHVERRS